MTWAAAAIGGAAAVGAGSSIFGSIMSGNAAGKSAASIRYSADKAADTVLTLNNRSRADLAPFRDLGVQSSDLIGDVLSGKRSIDDIFKGSSLYSFESEMGTRALDRQLKARGAYNSGAGLESLALFDKSLVAEGGDAYFNKLFNVTQLGENASAQTASNTTAAGNTVGQIQSQAGVGIGQAYLNQGAAYASGAAGVGNAVESGVTNWTNYSLYNPILQKYLGVNPSRAPGRDASADFMADDTHGLSTFT